MTPLQGTIGHPLAWLSRVTSPAFPAPDPVARTSMPNGMIATARLALASAALIIMYVDLAESERYVTVAVALYTVYSALLYVLWLRGRRPVPAIIEHLADVGWSVVLMAHERSLSASWPLGRLAFALAKAVRRSSSPMPT